MMLDTTEIKLAEHYRENENPEAMAIDDFITLTIRGIGVCEDVCRSRSLCGQDACQCIRRLLPHPEYYHLYELLRDRLLRAEFTHLIEEINNERRTS